MRLIDLCLPASVLSLGFSARAHLQNWKTSEFGLGFRGGICATCDRERVGCKGVEYRVHVGSFEPVSTVSLQLLSEGESVGPCFVV